MPESMDEEFLTAVAPELAGWAHPEGRLRGALEKDEFALYCQPILAFSGPERYPMGEVLVRPREEENSFLPPGDFFPVFEHYCMMPQLDRWVARKAVELLARGMKIPRLTINLSGQTLVDADFPRFVAGELVAHGISSEALLFELDENDALLRLDAAVRFARAYRAIGGAVMVDTGSAAGRSRSARSRRSPRAS